MKIEQKHFDAMINRTKCKFWDGDRKKIIGSLVGIAVNQEYPLYCEGRGYYENCEPLETETYVKEWFEIAKQLHKDGCTINSFGDFVNNKNMVWENKMWVTCGQEYKRVAEEFSYRSEWLEERGIEK